MRKEWNRLAEEATMIPVGDGTQKRRVIFKKTESQLEAYYKKNKRSQEIKNTMATMISPSNELLMSLLREDFPGTVFFNLLVVTIEDEVEEQLEVEDGYDEEGDRDEDDEQLQESQELYLPRPLDDSIATALAGRSQETSAPRHCRSVSECSDCNDTDCKGGAANGICNDLKPAPKTCKNCRRAECYSDRRRLNSPCLMCARCKDAVCNDVPCLVELASSESHQEYLGVVERLKLKADDRRRAKDRQRYKKRKISDDSA
jgi:hypothetical protein